MDLTWAMADGAGQDVIIAEREAAGVGHSQHYTVMPKEEGDICHTTLPDMRGDEANLSIHINLIDVGSSDGQAKKTDSRKRLPTPRIKVTFEARNDVAEDWMMGDGASVRVSARLVNHPYGPAGPALDWAEMGSLPLVWLESSPPSHPTPSSPFVRQSFTTPPGSHLGQVSTTLFKEGPAHGKKKKKKKKKKVLCVD
eukprot:Opistho-2@77642